MCFIGLEVAKFAQGGALTVGFVNDKFPSVCGVLQNFLVQIWERLESVDNLNLGRLNPTSTRCAPFVNGSHCALGRASRQQKNVNLYDESQHVDRWECVLKCLFARRLMWDQLFHILLLQKFSSKLYLWTSTLIHVIKCCIVCFFPMFVKLDVVKGIPWEGMKLVVSSR